MLTTVFGFEVCDPFALRDGRKEVIIPQFLSNPPSRMNRKQKALTETGN